MAACAAGPVEPFMFSGRPTTTTSTAWLTAMMSDPTVMAKLAHFGLHNYDAAQTAGIYNFLAASAYADRNFWVTEFNVWCDSCEAAPPNAHGINTWTYARGTAEYLIRNLADGASAGLIWEGYDSQYNYYSPGQYNLALEKPVAENVAYGLAARGIAHAAKGDTAAARAEQQAYLATTKLIPPGTSAGPVDVQTIVAVATPMLEGEILYRDGKTDEGIAKLREAVKAEDALRYFEPPAWFLPVRHALGAALMQSGRYAEAEQVYREDLKRLPENGWSLFGLAESLRVRGKKDEAALAAANFKAIWRAADTQIKSSCMCQPGLPATATQ
jgi:tetratricopeptide (TPR) repeat protein